MTVNVPASSLSRPSEDEAADERPRGGRRGSGGGRLPSRSQSFRTELHLLGQTAAEATTTLDRYLDDAVLAGVSAVRIVHGKGSGVLREAVAELLKRDRRVKRYRLAAYGEGDSGVTIAELR